MIELKKIERKHIENIGVSVDAYITIEKVEYIVNEALKYDKFTERNFVVDMLIMKLCTDIGDDIEQYNYDELVYNGIIEKVKYTIDNVNDIYLSIEQEEKVQAQLAKFLKTLSETVDKYGKNISKSMKGFDFQKALEALKNDKK